MKLQQRKKSTQETILVYGRHVANLAIERAPAAIKKIYIGDKFSDQKILAKISRSDFSVQPYNKKVLQQLDTSDANHQNIIVEINPKKIQHSLGSFLSSYQMTDHSIFIILGEIQDPQNVGAIIRSAAAFGVSAVIFPKHNQAHITGTVAKVSAGMIFSVPLIEVPNINTALLQLHDRGITSYALTSEGSVSVYDTQYASPSVLIIGNEGVGIRQKTLELAHEKVQIPMHPQCESLNAAATATGMLAVVRGLQGFTY